jgi:RNA polymerase sigma-70 factor (ECF subfamily)
MTPQDDTKVLLQKASQGDAGALGELFSRNQERLRQMVDVRLDRRLSGRLDSSDVLQEAYLEFSRSLTDYLRRPELPFYVWLRMITARRLQMLHRRHLGTQLRDAHREISLFQEALPPASSECLAAQLLGRYTTPSEAVMRAELQIRVQDALNRMEPIDREILVLRHFELLSNVETAHVLGLNEAAASNRFMRALKKLKKILIEVPGFVESRLH